MRITLLSLLVLLSSGLILTSCGDSEPSLEDLTAKGGKRYGGEFKFMSQEKITSLFPTHNADLYSSRIISQIYEPLMSYDVTAKQVVPAVAESFTKSGDSKEYTFKIRKGIKFHEDDCFGGSAPELKAEDVKFTLDLACSGLERNQISYLVKNRIEGGEEFFKKSKTDLPSGGVSGIKVIDDYTIKITLKSPTPGFERILSNTSLGIISKKSYEYYKDELDTHPVGSGPFMLESMTDDRIELKRNPNYWRKDEFGNQLPFLGKVIMTYSKDKRSELMAFREREIDLVLEIPVEEIQNILGSLKEAQEGKNVKHKVEGESSLSMSYVAMACESEEFKDMRVRKAFNLAINREEIIDNWLEGEGWAAMNGFVPEMPQYDNEAVKGHRQNVEKAKALMSQAGYANGANFPKLDFYVNAQKGSGVHKMCKAVASQLKQHLNVDLEIKLCSIDEREKAIASGKAKIWRAGWIADYPDPENFLSIFYGGNAGKSGSMVNSFQFKNESFDRVFEKASSEGDPVKRGELLVQCDQIVIDEAAIMPILTDDHIVMVNARVRNYAASPMEQLSLTSVFIKEPKQAVKEEE